MSVYKQPNVQKFDSEKLLSDGPKQKNVTDIPHQRHTKTKNKAMNHLDNFI